MRLKEKIAEAVFPPSLYCICCGKYIDTSRTYSLCDHCIRHMKFEMTDLTDDANGECFESASAAMGYGIYERQLVFGLKYDGHTYMARNIADILYDALIAQLAGSGSCPQLSADVIVPVPVHPDRLRRRGFNQAAKIAVHLGERTGIPVCEDALLRIKNTETQRALSARERHANMTDAFIVNPKRSGCINGRRILLIDDIYTTGATAVSCGDRLREGGAARVDFLSLLSAKNKDHGFIFLQNAGE